MSANYRQPAGLLIVTLFSVIVLYAFYGNLFSKLNQVCFASGGDGMQSYINMEYHIRYDSSYMRCNSMNYPYGEHVFFTNNQPLFSNTVKFISQNIVDISDYTLGMLNFLMLFFLVITPVILYLILTGSGVGPVISVLASIGITYLSPQIDRFGGHFNLSYVCAIPWMILLLMRFFKKPSALLSLLIALTMLAGALTHFYLYGFFALIMLFFYGAYLINDEHIFSNKLILLVHLFVQLVLPFLILQAFYISDHVTDRPSYPWGFLVYRAYPQSIFLPLSRPYGQFLHSFIKTNFIDWEGYAFVGMVAFAGTIFFLLKSARSIINKKYNQIWQVTSSRHLNILFWASLAGLLYSFGLPFILGMEWLVDLIGPVRQMRGIARFSWIFFYVMNIVTIYWLWDWWKNPGKKLVKALIIAAALLMLCTDAWYNVRNRGKWLENNIPALTDRDLKLPENQWIRRIDLTRYQAMIPLPYFHVGSENIWIDGGCNMVNQSFIAIKNSGLPCMGVMLSRTSVSQTLENVGFMLDPSCTSIDMQRFPSQKPFLLMAARCELPNDHERQLITHARWVDSSGVFDIYKLPFRAFQDIADSIAAVTNEEYRSLKLYDHNGLKSTDSLLTFRFLNFDNLPNASSYAGTGCFQGVAKKENVIFSGKLPLADTAQHYALSFWLNNVRKDLYPRTRVMLTETDLQGNIVFQESYQVSKLFQTIDGNWAFINLIFRLKAPENSIKVTIRNKTLRNQPVQVDNLLIRRQTTAVYQIEGQKLDKNNKFTAVISSNTSLLR
jgi:hypothetical protein